MRQMLSVSLCLCLMLSAPLMVSAQQASNPQQAASAERQGLSLITATPDEGFALAITLARRAVSTIQPNRSVLMEEREEYADDADSLIAASQVVAIHFQTIAQANDYWRD